VFLLKLNENQLKPILAKLIKWVIKSKRKKDEEENKEETGFPYNKHYMIIFFKIVRTSLFYAFSSIA
jgi:hypothetical protein